MTITIIDPRLIKEVAAMAARGFVRLPLSALQDKRLTMSDAAVLAVILDRCDDSSAQLSAAQIASAAGCCVRTAKSAISKLEGCGYIRVQRSAGAQSAYSCPDVLPPKRRWQKRAEEPTEDLSAYESVIGKFLY